MITMPLYWTLICCILSIHCSLYLHWLLVPGSVPVYTVLYSLLPCVAFVSVRLYFKSLLNTFYSPTLCPHDPDSILSGRWPCVRYRMNRPLGSAGKGVGQLETHGLLLEEILEKLNRLEGLESRLVPPLYTLSSRLLWIDERT